MEKRKAVEGDKIHILRVSMPEEDNEPFRTIALLADSTLYELAEAITESFGFDFDSSFGFYGNLDFWMDSVEGYELSDDKGGEGKFPGVEETSVGEVFNEPGREMLFLYDFSDQWSFRTQLEEIKDAEAGKLYPVVITFEGEAPLQYGDGELDDDDEIYDDEDDDEDRH